MQAISASVAQMQDFILEHFDLTTPQLAKYCRMYPNMMMDWRSNCTPAYDKPLERLKIIYAIAYDWALSSTIAPGRMIYMRVIDDTSLEDVLTADEIDLDKVAMIQQAFASIRFEEE